jgi:hypothetical protein
VATKKDKQFWCYFTSTLAVISNTTCQEIKKRVRSRLTSTRKKMITTGFRSLTESADFLTCKIISEGAELTTEEELPFYIDKDTCLS